MHCLHHTWRSFVLLMTDKSGAQVNAVTNIFFQTFLTSRSPLSFSVMCLWPQRTQYNSVAMTNQLILFREAILISCENLMENKCTLWLDAVFLIHSRLYTVTSGPVNKAWCIVRLRIIVNKQSRTADKVWPSNLRFGRSANSSSPYTITTLRKTSSWCM